MSCNNCGGTTAGNNCNCTGPIQLPIGPTGPQGVSGADGVNGLDGADGRNAYAMVNAKTLAPAIGSNILVAVLFSGQFSGSWAVIGQIVYADLWGYYEVVDSSDSSITLKNLGYPGNAIAGTEIGDYISPAGLIGPKGTIGATGPAGDDADNWTYLGSFATHPLNPNNLDFYRNTKSGGIFFYNGDTSTWEVLSIDGSQGGLTKSEITSAGTTISITPSSARQQLITTSSPVTLAGDVDVVIGAGTFAAGTVITVNYEAQIDNSGADVTIFGYTLNSAEAMGGLKVIATYDGVSWHYEYLQTLVQVPKVYKAFLGQTGSSNPPVAQVVVNTIGPIVWSRNSAGNYSATLAGAFPINKTFYFLGNNYSMPIGNVEEFRIQRAGALNEDELVVASFSNGVPSDTLLMTHPIHIEVHI